MINLIPAVLSTTECHDYVGGRPIFEELVAIYGDRHLKPLRTTPRGDSTWLRENLDAVLRLANAEGALSDRPRVESALAKWKKSKPVRQPPIRQSSSSQPDK